MVMDKRGFIKTIEAIIGIVMILGVMYLVIPKFTEKPMQQVPKIVETSQTIVTQQVLLNNEVRDCIIDVEVCPDGGVEMVGQVLEENQPPGYDYAFNICNTPNCVCDTNCKVPKGEYPVTGEVFMSDLFVSSDVVGKNHKIVRFWMWKSSDAPVEEDQCHDDCEDDVCENGMVKECKTDVDSDECKEFDTNLVACPSPQVCSNGACVTQSGCVNDCDAGEVGCSGPSQKYTCGEANDGDTCLEMIIVACPVGETCSGGVCQGAGTPGCDGICQAGETCDGTTLCSTGEQLPEGATCNACTLSVSLPSVPSKDEIVIGVEYGAIGQQEPLALTGVPGVKIATFKWDEIQKCDLATGLLLPLDPDVDFKAASNQLDKLVKKYQTKGMKELVIGLDPQSKCASQGLGKRLPKTEYKDDYQAFVKAFVERYDNDDFDDVPDNLDGKLLYPVKYYEVGIEFSSFMPDPVADYVLFLETTQATIHQAYQPAVVLHAPFITTKAFELDPSPLQYPDAFTRVPDKFHSLADIREVLNHPEMFDMLNVHSLGDPYEIEGMVKWLKWEMNQRPAQYPQPKKIFISDTGVTPFGGWGQMVDCDAASKGKVIDPTQETQTDRCRLAEYFKKLGYTIPAPPVPGDPATLAWVHAYAAADHVKRTVIAADQDIHQIDLAFTNDLIFQQDNAGAGNGGWVGMTEIAIGDPQNCVLLYNCRAPLWSIKQLQSKISGYSKMGRIQTSDPNVRVYLFMKGSTPIWVAWYEDPKQLILPGDSIPSKPVSLAVGKSSVMVEKVVTQDGKTYPTPTTTPVTAPNNIATVTLTPTPVYIY